MTGCSYQNGQQNFKQRARTPGTVPGWGVGVFPAAASWWWRCCWPHLTLGLAGAGAGWPSWQWPRGWLLPSGRSQQLWVERAWAGWTPWGTSAAWGSQWQECAEGTWPVRVRIQASVKAVCVILWEWRWWELAEGTDCCRAILRCKTPAQHHL